MKRNALVQRGFLQTETLAGATYVQAIGFRDRLIGALGSALIFLVDQTDVAKHIAVESEDSREAIWHPVVERKRSSNPPSQGAEPVLKCGYGSSDERSHGKTTDAGRDSADCGGVCNERHATE
jgi:hypothetical protein